MNFGICKRVSVLRNFAALAHRNTPQSASTHVHLHCTPDASNNERSHQAEFVMGSITRGRRFPFPGGRVLLQEGVKGLMIDLAPHGPEEKKSGWAQLQAWRAGVCSTEPPQNWRKGFPL
jgi:hypothetical protein